MFAVGGGKGSWIPGSQHSTGLASAFWTNPVWCGEWSYKRNKNNLEQKIFDKLVLRENYTTCLEALKNLRPDQLKLKREKLTLAFAKSSLGNGKLWDLFPIRKKPHIINTRRPEKYVVQHANTERLKNSPILTMQRLLNQNT